MSRHPNEIFDEYLHICRYLPKDAIAETFQTSIQLKNAIQSEKIKIY